MNIFESALLIGSTTHADPHRRRDTILSPDVRIAETIFRGTTMYFAVFITVHELMAKLREDGIDDVSRVKSALLEGDGNISVIPYDEK